MIKTRSTRRPVEVFNATKRAHRELLANFLRTASWADSPVRFVASESTEVDVNTMQRQLLEYYTQKEFDKTALKTLDTAA